MCGGCCIDGDSYSLTQETVRGYGSRRFRFADGVGVASGSEDEFDGYCGDVLRLVGCC